MPQIPFVGPSFKSRSPNLDAQVCINLFPVMGESGTAKSVRALFGTPGTRPLAVVGDGPIRGMHRPTNGGAAVVVSGNAVYRVNPAMELTFIGHIDDKRTPVVIRDNGEIAVIVSGSSGWSVKLDSNAVTQIVDTAFYGASHVAFLDTFFIFNRPGTSQFYVTGSGGLTFDALDFASTESNAESVVALVESHGELMLFKETVTEIWRVSGGVDFPFTRDMNASIEQGCAAPMSPVAMDNSVFWLGQNTDGGGIVWRMNGYTPQRVSTDAIESAIASYPDVSDAIGYSYQQEGHTFYVLTFPSGNATWVYDAAMQMWHQRAYLDPTTGKLTRHRSNCHVYYAGKHVVGDYETGEIYALDLDYMLDRAGDPLPAIRAASHVTTPDYKPVVHRRVQVDFETGVGTVDGQGANPVVMLDWSDDGGHTWSNQHAASLGQIGQYKTRAVWTRLGRARDRVYRITITDPVKRTVLGASLNPGG
jgi:hypothetical protein